jgi:CBS domain-containing protein
MARKVAEVMSRELFSVTPGDAADDAIEGLLALAVNDALVLDDDRKPVGAVSLRDLVGRRPGDRVCDRMSRPALTVSERASVGEAARLMAESGRQRLAAVDAAGRAVGLVSALDLVRGLLGLEAPRPARSPRMNLSAGVVWTDELPLEPSMFEAAPDGAGLLVLIHGGPSISKRVVWAEACDDVRTRLMDMLAAPQTEEPLLAFWLKRPGLRFRAAAARDAAVRRETAEELRRRADLPITESRI